MKKLTPFLPYLFVFIVSSLPLFAHLDSLPVRLWDESRLATNAYEMYKSNNLLITTFQGEPDHWNTKPPLLIWMQCLGMKLFGVSEVAVRLPSVLAGLGIFMSLVFFFQKIGFSQTGPFVVTVMLLASDGFNGDHGLRFGEYDAMLSFFMLTQCLSFYQYLKNRHTPHRNQFLFIFFLSILLAIWTKGVAGLILSPVFLMWWLILRMWNFDSFLRMSLYVIGTLIAAVSYYLLREAYDPGYIDSAISEEITNRYVSEPDDSTKPWDYYIMQFPIQTNYFIYLIIPAILAGFLVSNKGERMLQLFFFSGALFYFLVIQTSDGKNFWYTMPIYPILYLTFGLSAEVIIRRVFKRRNPVGQRLLYITLAISLLIVPYYDVVSRTIGTQRTREKDYGFYNVTNYLRDQLRSEEKIHLKYIDTEYSAHNWWYIARLKDKGYSIAYYDHLDSIGKGDMLLIRQEVIADSLNKVYQLEDQGLDLYSCWLFKIVGVKHHDW